MKILSIHRGHDASLCLYENGKIKRFILSERISRIKHDDNIKILIDYFFDYLYEKIDYLIISRFATSDLSSDEKNIKYFFSRYDFKNNVEVSYDFNHHLNHAMISFYNSGFDESLVIVVDGSGSMLTSDGLTEVESIYYFNKFENRLLYKNVIEQIFSSFTLPWDKKFNGLKKSIYDYKNIFGIGILYDMSAILIGSNPGGCGKAMGLSSYGSPNPLFQNIFLEKNTLNNYFFKQLPEEYKKFLKTPSKKITRENYKLYADLCYEVQNQTQKAVGDLIDEKIKETGIRNVCISGGYGMNVVANHYLLKRFPEVKFYFEPLCGDAGLSVGSSISKSYQVNKNNLNHEPLKTTSFHGILHDVSSYKGKESSIIEIAELLYRNKSVAVYTGISESGQRALGNRSIFFNPLNTDAKKIVNEIKKREWYRPFAAVVLEEDAEIYFDMGKIKSSPFMTVCFPVKKEYSDIIRGVVHVDNTCRIQTVSDRSSYLYNLLQEFKHISGHGLLLNTSFNLAGHPLVETPEDALYTLNNSSLDYLLFEETNQLISN